MWFYRSNGVIWVAKRDVLPRIGGFSFSTLDFIECNRYVLSFRWVFYRKLHTAFPKDEFLMGPQKISTQLRHDITYSVRPIKSHGGSSHYNLKNVVSNFRSEIFSSSTSRGWSYPQPVTVITQRKCGFITERYRYFRWGEVQENHFYHRALQLSSSGSFIIECQYLSSSSHRVIIECMKNVPLDDEFRNMLAAFGFIWGGFWKCDAIMLSCLRSIYLQLFCVTDSHLVFLDYHRVLSSSVTANLQFRIELSSSLIIEFTVFLQLSSNFAPS